MQISQLSTITIYPVKSLAGINVTSWRVTDTGLAYDRKWMLIDSHGDFLSQRKLPAMALIKTRMTESELILSAPGQEDLTLPLATTTDTRIPCTVWEHEGTGLVVSALADEWFSSFLQQTCRLVCQPDDCIRGVDPVYGQINDRVSFSDGFPFLIISENSLTSLNQAMGLSVPMSRFRPNLVITGCPAYAEDYWREITIGNIDFRLPKPCSRCSVPTIDQETGKIGKEPLTTLNRLRKWQNKVYFGQNAIHNQLGILTVGDTVTINLSGLPQPPL